MRGRVEKTAILGIFAFFVTFAAFARAESVDFAGARPLFWGGLRESLERYGNVTGAPVSATAGGCSEAVTGLKSGKITIGGMCCLVDRSLSDFEVYPVAKDAITIIVHPSNPVSDLSLEQVRGIYHGEITDWSQVGGAKGKIIPVFRDHCDYENEFFKREVIGAPESLAATALVVDTIAKTIDYVSKYPKSIGQVSSVFSMGEPSVKVTRLDGVAPSSGEIASGRYRLSRTLTLITRKNPPDEVTGFINFLKGPEGRKILGKRLTPITDGEK